MVTFWIIAALIFLPLGFLLYYKTNNRIKKSQELSRNPFHQDRNIDLGDLGTSYGFGTTIIGDGYVADMMFGLPIWIRDRVDYSKGPSVQMNYGWLKEEKSSIKVYKRIPWDWKSLLFIMSIYYGCALVGIGLLWLILQFG